MAGQYFIWSVCGGKVEIVELMIDNAEVLKIDLIARDDFGRTGFQWAKERRHADVVNLINRKMPNIDF